MRMVVSVTPWSVAPVAFPDPHGEARSPKVTGGAPVDEGLGVAAFDAIVGSGEALRLPVHPPAATAQTSSAMTPRALAEHPTVPPHPVEPAGGAYVGARVVWRRDVT